MDHVLRRGNRSIVYSEVRYRYLLLKSKKRFRNHRKCKLLSFILLLIKYLTSCQHKQLDNKNAPKTHFGLDSPKFVPLMDKLSADLQKAILAILHIRYMNHKSFIRLYLLLSGDV